MLTLEKVIELDEKVNNTVQVIEDLRKENQQLKAFRNENDLLRASLKEYQEKVAVLEKQVASFKSEQDKIESGIQNVVLTLDKLLTKATQKEAESACDSSLSSPLKAKEEDLIGKAVFLEAKQTEEAKEFSSSKTDASLASPQESLSFESPLKKEGEDPSKASPTPFEEAKKAVIEEASFSDVEIDETIENLDIF